MFCNQTSVQPANLPTNTLLHSSFPGFPDMLICTQKWTDRWRIGYKVICIVHFFLPIAIVVSFRYYESVESLTLGTATSRYGLGSICS